MLNIIKEELHTSRGNWDVQLFVGSDQCFYTLS